MGPTEIFKLRALLVELSIKSSYSDFKGGKDPALEEVLVTKFPTASQKACNSLCCQRIPQALTCKVATH
jgi:hypothetical protein